MRRARAGDAHAFAALYVRHERRLRALCWRLLGDSGLVEEVAQQAAVEALVGLSRLASPERFGAWLLAIAGNLCRHRRRSSAHRLVSLDALLAARTLPEPPAMGLEPASAVEAGEQTATLCLALARLPPGQRRAVELYYLCGLTVAETATVLGVEVGAVKARLHKARLGLRRRLQTEGSSLLRP